MYRPKVKKWVLFEKASYGATEIISNESFKKVRDEYDRIYEESDAPLDWYFERFRNRQANNNRNMLSVENGESNEQNSGHFISAEIQDNAKGSRTDSTSSDSRENLTSDERSTEDDGAFSNAKSQNKDTTADIDTDVIQSLTEANKQLTKELGKAQVTNEKILERAEKLAEKRKEKSKQKMADMRKLVKLQGTVNAYSRGSLDAIASQLVKYSGAENIDKSKLIDKLQNYYAWLTNYGLKSDDMSNALKQAQARISSMFIDSYGSTDEEKIKAEAASQDIAEKVIDLYWNAQPVKTPALKAAQQINELKQQNKVNLTRLVSMK